MRKCLTQTVPYGVVQCLSRLNAVSDSSWTLYYYNTPDSKIKAATASSSDGYEEESSEQDQEQEEEADDMEETDNNVLSEQSTRTEDAQLAGCMLNRLHGRDFQFN
jgi:hypothetical protein